MSTVVNPPGPLEELQRRLGGVPLDRIRLYPPPGTATLQDVLHVDARENRLCELVAGTLVEKPMGFSEGFLASILVTYLNLFVRPRKLGMVIGDGAPIELMAQLVRLPDVSFVNRDRLPDRRRPTDPIPAIVPNLAVEVLSRSNTVGEMRVKRGEYFAAGVELVWEVDPIRRTVAIYTTVDNPTILTVADTLDGGTVLPGFQLSLAEFFGELDEEY